MFDLRADGCVDEDAWAELVSEDLRLTLPITPYRSFSPADVVKNRRVLLGVDGESFVLIWRFFLPTAVVSLSTFGLGLSPSLA